MPLVLILTDLIAIPGLFTRFWNYNGFFSQAAGDQEGEILRDPKLLSSYLQYQGRPPYLLC